MAPIDCEVRPIHRENSRIPVLLSHAHNTSVRQIHGAIPILVHERSNRTRLSLKIEVDNHVSTLDHSQNRIATPQDGSYFCYDRFACEKGRSN